ncbi:MAG: ABC transporter ATP-binding protein [Lactovum sp.]
MSEKLAIEIKNVSKSFRLPTESTRSLRTTLVNFFRGIKGYKVHEVLRDINFRVNKGEFFGVIGRNGSGKSTLLKIISEIYKAEKGTVEVNGKLVSFIELGVGFNPELTGRENVYLNGAMLGFSHREIDEMYTDIVDFAELSDFMNQKLKNYSSGMQVRLAFSVAIKAKSEILVLDEVLAVGDESFQKKCHDYFLERKQLGLTTILVTHDMNAVKKYCDRAIYIKDGKVEACGNPAEVAAMYSVENLIQVENLEDSAKHEPQVSSLVPEFSLKLLSDIQIKNSEDLIFNLNYRITEDLPVAFNISLSDSMAVSGSVVDSGLFDENYEIIQRSDRKGVYHFQFKLPLTAFSSRTMKVEAALFKINNTKNLELETIAMTAEHQSFSFLIIADNQNNALLQEMGQWKALDF